MRFDRIVNEYLFNVCICFHNNRDKSQRNSCCIIRFFRSILFFIIKSCENQPTLQLKSSYLHQRKRYALHKKKNVWNSNYRSSKNWRKLTVKRQFSLYASFIFDWISFVNYAQFWSHFSRFFLYFGYFLADFYIRSLLIDFCIKFLWDSFSVMLFLDQQFWCFLLGSLVDFSFSIWFSLGIYRLWFPFLICTVVVIL